MPSFQVVLTAGDLGDHLSPEEIWGRKMCKVQSWAWMEACGLRDVFFPKNTS